MNGSEKSSLSNPGPTPPGPNPFRAGRVEPSNICLNTGHNYVGFHGPFTKENATGGVTKLIPAMYFGFVCTKCGHYLEIEIPTGA